MWKALAAITALTVALTIPALVVAQEAPASQKSLAEQLVDAFNGVFGAHPGMRANHPKGVVLEGTFTPDTKGQVLQSNISQLVAVRRASGRVAGPEIG